MLALRVTTGKHVAVLLLNGARTATVATGDHNVEAAARRVGVGNPDPGFGGCP
jgi:hypothetical protein